MVYFSTIVIHRGIAQETLFKSITILSDRLVLGNNNRLSSYDSNPDVYDLE